MSSSSVLRSPRRSTRERRKVALFVALSFLCLGLPRVITNATAFALFLDAFDAAKLPYTYLGAAVLAPLVGAGYLWLNRRVSFWTLILSALLFDILALSLAWLGLQTPLAGAFIALLAVWVEVEWMITGLVFWGLAERMFTLRDAKRLFGVISAGEPAAVICGGFAISFLLTFLDTRDLIMVTAAAMTIGLLVILAVRALFGLDLAEGDGDEEEPSGFNVFSGFGRYQSYVNLIFLIVLLAEIVHFIVDNAFYDLAQARYPEQAALASFIGAFFSASGAINLLCNVFVSGWVLRRYGAGVAMLSLPVLIVATGTGAVAAARLFGYSVAFFAMVAWTKLIDEAVRNGVYTTGFLTVYQPLPAELRTRAHAASGSYVEQIAAGVAGVALLGLNLALGFGALELTVLAVFLALGWAWAARRQFQRYGDVLRQMVARRHPGSVVVTLEDEATLTAMRQHLVSQDAAEAIYALGLIEKHAPAHLPDAVLALLHHRSAAARREALRAAEHSALAKLADAIDACLTTERDEEVTAHALRALAAARRARAIGRLVPYLHHRSERLRWGAVIGLTRYCGIEGIWAASETLGTLLDSGNGDEWHGAQAMLEDLALLSIRGREVWGADEIRLRPILSSVLSSDEGRRTDSGALRVASGEILLTRLAIMYDRRNSDAGTRERIASILGHIGSPAALGLLFDRLHSYGLNERLAVARALGAGKFVADPVQAQEVWAEIDASLEIASLLETGAALDSADDRMELLRAACREARERERERLFLLLAQVLPRQRVLQVAWSNAGDAEDVRAYALEVLDTLLPGRRKLAVFRLLDDTPERHAPPSATLSAFLEGVCFETPSTAWIRCCALYAAQTANVLPPLATIRLWAGSPEPSLSGVARAILGESVPGDTHMLAIEKVMVLRSVELFEGVPSQFLAAIADLLSEREVRRGEVVIREGEMGAELYVIVRGSVEVTHNGRALATLGPREIFGELVVLDPGPRSATVTATSDGLLLSLDHEHVEYLIAGSIEIAQAFIRMLCRRLRETNERVATPASSE